jgi:Mrp family chromosome partitioning ATPase
VNANVIGIVLNKLDKKAHGNYYYYQYYYYGESEDVSPQKNNGRGLSFLKRIVRK